jgi:serine/threonine protein kinase
MLGYCKKDNYVCLVTEYIDGGTLSNLIFGDAGYDPISLGISLCKGMVYLHNKGIIHRDLKPSKWQNLFFS